MTIGRPRLSVLLVEDDIRDSRLLIEALAPAITAGEVVVQTVKRLEAARQELSRYDFNCVLLDLGLPDATGVDNVRTLRLTEPRVAIIVLTGINDEKTALEAMKLGAQDYLVKGEIDASRLTKLIRQAIERHRQSLVPQASDEPSSPYEKLTQLPSAALFLDRARMRLIHSRSRNEPFALLCLEIDGIDMARRRFGDLVADELIRKLALRLGELLQPGDTLARIGMQVFALLPQTMPESLAGLQDWAGRAASRVQSMTQVGDCALQLSLHAGFAWATGPADTVDALVDEAMEDLRRRRADQDIHAAMPSAFTAESPAPIFAAPVDAIDAADGEWLPWFDAATGQGAGADWLSPECDPHGSPLDVAAAVLRQAGQLVAQAQQWRTAGFVPPQFGFRLPAAALLQPQFAVALTRCFSPTTLAHEMVLLRINESVFRQPVEYAECLTALHLAGFRMAMDGDGSTSISLADFSRFPVDTYCLSRDFVRQLLGESLQGPLRRFATAAIAAAQSLGAVVIASGVDHDDSLQALRLIGVRYMQGHCFMAPVNTADLPASWARSAGVTP